MRLIKADFIMSWRILKESRTIHAAEYVDWTIDPWTSQGSLDTS